MVTATRLAWRVAGFAAFGATATLAVVLSSRGPAPVNLVSVRGSTTLPACARPAVQITALADRLEFTNLAAVSCELTGYPAAELPGAVAAGRLDSPVVMVTLRRGTSAYARLEVSDRGCRHPVMIGVLGVRLPGDRAYSYVGYREHACSVRVGAFRSSSGVAGVGS